MHRFKKNNFFCFVYIKWLKLLKKYGKEMVVIEVIVFNVKKLLNETNIKDQLIHSNLAAVTLQYPLKYRKQRQELQNCGNCQPCRIFLKESLAMQIIIDCRTTPAVNFRTRLGFHQYDPIMTKEQSVLSKITGLFI